MRRLAPTLATLAAALPIAFFVGMSISTPSPTDVVGTYDVPTGTLTVYGDGSGTYVPTPGGTFEHEGLCWTDTRPEDQVSVYACAPLTSPDGFPVDNVWEDGSAEYPGSGFYFDPELQHFVPVDSGA